MAGKRVTKRNTQFTQFTHSFISANVQPSYKQGGSRNVTLLSVAQETRSQENKIYRRWKTTTHTHTPTHL